jgi:putative ABC transport system permease protein
MSTRRAARPVAEIDRLGTNMLTVEAGQSLTGRDAQLPLEAPARITLLDHVQRLAHTALIKDRYVYRNSMIPVGNTGGLEVQATGLNLLPVLNTGVARGSWLNEGTAREPVAGLRWHCERHERGRGSAIPVKGAIGLRRAVHAQEPQGGP